MAAMLVWLAMGAQSALRLATPRVGALQVGWAASCGPRTCSDLALRLVQKPDATEVFLGTTFFARSAKALPAVALDELERLRMRSAQAIICPDDDVTQAQLVELIDFCVSRGLSVDVGTCERPDD